MKRGAKAATPAGRAPIRATAAPRPRAWIGAVTAGVVIVTAGSAYRLLAATLDAQFRQPVRLPQPLAALPMTIGTWQGEDVEVPEAVQRIAQNDDSVNRRYHETLTGGTVNVHVGYTARPRTMRRHRPTVCYTTAGWSHLGTRSEELAIDGRRLPVLVHRFMKPGIEEMRIVVVNYYVLNGQLTADEALLGGLRLRAPNLRRDASRYVAQVQVMVSATPDVEAAEQMAKRFACESALQVLTLLPRTGVRSSGFGVPSSECAIETRNLELGTPSPESEQRP